MINWKIFFIWLLCVVFVTGCAETKILERISLATLIGYDLEEEDKVTTSVIIRQVNPDTKSSLETQSNTEPTSKGTRIKVNLQTAKKLAAGQVRVILLGQELAKSGIEETLHTLMMNSEFSSSMYLAVVEGEAKTLIEGEFKNISDIGQHVFSLIDHNVKQQLSVSSTLHEVVRNNYSRFRDIAMPILKKEGEMIKISGLAVFKKDKMVGNLSTDDLFYIIMLRDKFKSASLELTLPSNTLDQQSKKDLEVAIDSIKSNRTIQLVNRTTPEFDVNVDIQCRLVEIHANASTGDPKVIEKLEQAMNKKIESELNRIINHTQKLDSDIFGFGDYYHANVRNAQLDESTWYGMYPNLKVNVNVNVKIIRNGVFE